MNKTFMMRNVEPASPITFDTQKCIGCNRCMEACPIDLFLPAEKKGAPPVVAYPDECWYCGCCVMECPKEAIKLKHPLMNQPRWVEKSSLLKERNMNL
ncbi:ferredoxin family protein [Sedimentibacter sp.]|uniref:4Fe-4S dicluster domain-containing protein n=1 Tax=Sedimentibacter sp. TaxID=1960295 RepID=UPI0028A9CF06|nr:ferredoxin family protein [Sedimentibacter sp.]